MQREFIIILTQTHDFKSCLCYFRFIVIRRASSSRCVRLFRTIRKPYSRQKSISHCFATKVSPCAVTARSRRLEIHLPTVFAVYPSRRATSCSVSASGRSNHVFERRSQKSAGGTRGWHEEAEGKICGRTSGIRRSLPDTRSHPHIGCGTVWFSSPCSRTAAVRFGASTRTCVC